MDIIHLVLLLLHSRYYSESFFSVKEKKVELEL